MIVARNRHCIATTIEIDFRFELNDEKSSNMKRYSEEYKFQL